MVEVKNLTIEELKELKKAVIAEIKVRNEEIKEAERLAKAERSEKFTGNVNAGDKIRFLYNCEGMTGLVERANPKSVTVVFEDEKRHYIKYENVLEVIEVAQVQEEEILDEVAV